MANTMDKLRVSQALIDWNRAQPEPPIKIGMECVVADAILREEAQGDAGAVDGFDFRALHDFLSAAWEATGCDKSEGSHARDLYEWKERAYYAMRRQSRTIAASATDAIPEEWQAVACDAWAIIRPDARTVLPESVRASEHAARWSIGNWAQMQRDGFTCIPVRIIALSVHAQGIG